MKNWRTLAAVLLLGTAISLQAQSTPTKYKVVTVIESIIPGGLGRSRMIENQSELDYQDFTTERTSGKDSGQNKIKRNDAKIDEMSETMLLNFYSLTGINFQNVASNDAMITSRINTLTEQGWELAFVTSAVESDSGKTDGEGIFITRLIFKK